MTYSGTSGLRDVYAPANSKHASNLFSTPVQRAQRKHKKEASCRRNQGRRNTNTPVKASCPCTFLSCRLSGWSNCACSICHRSNRRASSSCSRTSCCCNGGGLHSCGCRTARNTNRLLSMRSGAACDNCSGSKTCSPALYSCSASGTRRTANSRLAPRRLPSATGSHSEVESGMESGNAGTPEPTSKAACMANGSDRRWARVSLLPSSLLELC